MSFFPILMKAWPSIVRRPFVHPQCFRRARSYVGQYPEFAFDRHCSRLEEWANGPSVHAMMKSYDFWKSLRLPGIRSTHRRYAVPTRRCLWDSEPASHSRLAAFAARRYEVNLLPTEWLRRIQGSPSCVTFLFL